MQTGLSKVLPRSSEVSHHASGDVLQSTSNDDLHNMSENVFNEAFGDYYNEIPDLLHDALVSDNMSHTCVKETKSVWTIDNLQKILSFV